MRQNPFYAALVAGCIVAAGPASAATITAHASAASVYPATVPGAQSLQNGDFFIAPNPSPYATTGDGVDEFTYWSFNFTTDPGYSNFIAGGTVSSAVLTLTLTSAFFINGAAPITDRVIISSDTQFLNGSQWNVPSFMNGTFGVPQTGTVSVDLVANGNYTGDSVFAWLTSNNGMFPINYGDDALVTAATLQLNQAAVPEPETYALFLAGLGVLGASLRRKAQR